MIKVKRVYDPAEADDGIRVLVDRVWPRGIKKADARLDAWRRDLAPSTNLRKWYGHDPAKWPEFERLYRQEIESAGLWDEIKKLAVTADRSTVTLLTASKAVEISNAAAISRMIGEISSRKAA